MFIKFVHLLCVSVVSKSWEFMNNLLMSYDTAQFSDVRGDFECLFG